jgi:translation elongation factor EF-1alpha
MELFKNYPLLGRVILREKTSTIAAGVVISMIE